ncbi:hypothetical protein AVEN_40952-1 [Araneus ventricosus]|uniref:Uncharacterized protein n=1 Tax=Araneus ventricosus TaxID=182803 RepID=A0A4Y2F9U7_ARAVE|nr:hypothetical protein AVEN_40952-1 [Araneus ventricosus]
MAGFGKKTRRESIHSQKENCKKLYEEIALTLSEVQRQRDTLKTKNKDLKSKLDKFKNDLTLEKSRLNFIYFKTTDFEKLYKEIKVKLSECQGQRDDLETENEGLKLKLKKEKSEMQQKEKDLKNEQESLKTQLITLQESHSDICKKIQTMEGKQSQLNEK